MPPPPNWTPELSQPTPGADAALALGWTWPAARSGCDEHKRGFFAISWQLWLDLDSLPSIRGAKAQRLAVPCGLPWEVFGSTRAPARFETEAGRLLWRRHLRRLLRMTLSDVIGMGFSVWQHPTAVNPVTLRREVITVERWPLSQVRYTATPFPDPWTPGQWIQGYYAIQFGVGESVGDVLYGPQSTGLTGPGVRFKFIQLPRPGETDGHWTVVCDPDAGDQPHMTGAVTACDVTFVAGTLAKRNRANLGKSLGRQVPVGELPPDTAVDSPEGKALGKTVAELGVTTAGALIPSGAKIGGYSMTTQTASFFTEDALLNLQDVEMAILGRIQTRGAQYVAKDGVEAAVPEDLVRADVGTIERGASALMQLLAEQNTPTPGRVYLTGHLPDIEQAARRKERQEAETREAEKLAKFHNAVSVERANGFEFRGPAGQARLNLIAASCGVAAPVLPPDGLPPALVKVPAPTVPITGQDAAQMPTENRPPAAPDAP